MSTTSKRWKLILRCYQCGERFKMPYDGFKGMQTLPMFKLCPSCEIKPMIFRKPLEGDTWHFLQDCSEWPSADFTERGGLPVDGAFCKECVSSKKLTDS